MWWLSFFLLQSTYISTDADLRYVAMFMHAYLLCTATGNKTKKKWKFVSQANSIRHFAICYFIANMWNRCGSCSAHNLCLTLCGWLLISYTIPALFMNKFHEILLSISNIEYDLIKYICYWKEKLFCSNLCILISNFPWQFQIFHSTSWLFKPLHGSTWMKSATGIFYFHQQFWGAPQLP